jgi:aminopeptidase
MKVEISSMSTSGSPAISSFIPSETILRRYANVFTQFGLHGGEGMRPGEIVRITLPECALPFYLPLQAAILKAGGNLVLDFRPNGSDRQLLEWGNEQQLTFFLDLAQRELAAKLDHVISLRGTSDPHELEGYDPQKIMMLNEIHRRILRKWLYPKEVLGRFSWTLGLYGTEAMAAEVGMSLQEYWGHIISACMLDEEDPVGEWRKVQAEMERVKQRLDALEIDRLHIESADGIDLWVRLGQHRHWLACSGRNIPSYEIFTSPDWRGTEGVVVYNQPLYYNGSVITGIRLVFKEGRVVEAQATQNEALLRAMLAKPNADKVGEFSLTDKRLSRILVPMGVTLYDENLGGPFGNTHLAVGKCYVDAYAGDISQVSTETLLELGFNDPSCEVHTDMISTSDRTVTAVWSHKPSQVIYANGQLTV